jgi:class 3 adenylate cyclase/tetratricopeptide (TPR) repeat protein
VAPDSRYCDNCGIPLPQAAAIASTPARFGTRRTYTPVHLAERILAARQWIEGERKHITVLFADIKSSMELLADRDPEEARALLDPVLEQMIEAVHAHEGIVNQVMGDGIMALFGAPLALEDHALRAGLAALRMRDSLARHGDEVQRRHGVPLQIRIGLNSGDVLVRSIGSDLDMDYTAVGQTTHLAARLEQMAKPGTALCSAATHRLAEGYFRVRALGAVPVRGLAEPVEVMELLGVERPRLRFHATAARGLTPFVGRAAELESIARVLEAASAGRGQIVSLVGEPGVGKSRLVWETTHSLRVRDWLVLECGAVSDGVGTPYLPIRSLLQAYFEIRHVDGPAEARDRVVKRLLALGPEVAELATPIQAVLDLPVADRRWEKLDPPQRRQESNDAIRRLLLRESETRPVLMVVEDLHWTDRESEAFLDSLVDRLSTMRLALVVNCRPEYLHAWSNKASYTQVRVEPLPREDVVALLTSLLGEDRSLEPVLAILVEQGGGNPFFLEEMIRELAGAGVLVGATGRYRVARPPARTLIPPTVQAVIAARIDRLAAEDKHVLRIAASVGPVIAFEILDAVSGVGSSRLSASLARLRDTEFLYESRTYPEVAYAFTHALTREVAYGEMTHDQRRSMHAGIAAAMERVYAERSDEHVEQLARHAMRGELWEKAVSHSRKAATKAAARSAYREARVHFENALAALPGLPQDRQALELAVDLRLDMRSVLFPLREIARDLESLQLAMATAERLGDDRRLARILTYMTRDLSILGKPARAIEAGQRALSLAASARDLELEILANAYLGSVCLARGEYRQAVDTLRHGLAAIRGADPLARFGLPGPAAVLFRVWLVAALVRLGDYPDAEDEVSESRALAEKADQPLSMLVAQYSAGFLLSHRGDLARAIEALEASLSLCRKWRLPAWFSNVASVLGWSYARSGRMSEGIELMRQAIAESVAGGGMVNHSSEVVRLAEVQLLAGRLGEAQSLGEQALDLAQRHEERGNEAIALRLLGEVAMRREPRDDAAVQDLLGRALAIALAQDMKPLASACRSLLETIV